MDTQAPARTIRAMATKAASKAKATKWALAQGAKATTAASRRAEELLELIARRKKRITEDFYEIGQALAEIRKKKLYVALGYESFAKLLTARAVMSVRSAEKLIEVVQAVPRTRALDLGPEKSYALARLVAATPEVDSVETILERGVHVGKKRKPVAALSTREFDETTRAVRPTKKKDALAVTAERTARALQAVTRASGARAATATTSKIAGGFEVVLRVPVAQCDALLRALR